MSQQFCNAQILPFFYSFAPSHVQNYWSYQMPCLQLIPSHPLPHPLSDKHLQETNLPQTPQSTETFINQDCSERFYNVVSKK